MKAYEDIRTLKARLDAENVYLQEELLREHQFDEIVGNSTALLEVLRKDRDPAVLAFAAPGVGEMGAAAKSLRHINRGRPSGETLRPLFF